MMLEPSIDQLLEKIDSKYMLVTVSAQRARELQDIDNKTKEGPKEHSETRKYIGEALDEIMADELTYTYEQPEPETAVQAAETEEAEEEDSETIED